MEEWLRASDHNDSWYMWALCIESLTATATGVKRLHSASPIALLCAHTHTNVCNFVCNVSVNSVLNWNETNSKCQNIITTMLGLVIWTHQITNQMTESVISDQVIWTSYRKHTQKRFLTFSDDQIISARTAHSHFVCLFCGLLETVASIVGVFELASTAVRTITSWKTKKISYQNLSFTLLYLHW